MTATTSSTRALRRGNPWFPRGPPPSHVSWSIAPWALAGQSPASPATGDSVSSAERSFSDDSRDESHGSGADPRRRPRLPHPLVVGAVRAQAACRRRRGGPVLLGLRRQALPRLRFAARQRLHRPPAPARHPGDQGPGRQALHDRPADGERQAVGARPPHRRGDARRPEPHVLHERRRRGERERDQDWPAG